MNPDRLKEMITLARARLAESKADQELSLENNLNKLSSLLETEKPDNVDMSLAGIPDKVAGSQEGLEAGADFVTEVTGVTGARRPDAGVARDVSLNAKQALFMNTMLDGDDLCLIGAAGTGKTTCVGKSIRAKLDQGSLKPLKDGTKWLVAGVPGCLITSFTRKAVNNIKRATPEALKPHVLTMHKVLEFAPVFYEIEDPNDVGKFKKTMKFEPQRTAINPIPSDLSLVFFEESSMIGTDLYNLWKDATPHGPQEVFIGDIRQLPPVFGAAILGFKMALLPVIELDEVYRQALLSPIIRLAHAILSGDASKFDPKVVTTKQMHPHLGRMIERKSVPSLEKFDESSEHGLVKIQIWQKTLPEDIACLTAIKQFTAWIEDGYYQANDDLILCPFNKGFGTVELNKGIQQYLGKQRDAVVHEVIAGFNTHYLAEGDRVLYDKEDAFITVIQRNASYLGKSPRPASTSLNRWGTYEEELSQQEVNKASSEEAELTEHAMDEFLNSFSEDGDDARVNAASHVVTIKFAYSEEIVILTSASEINNLLGGHAITVHKAQGSENRAVFVVLHKSHSVMLQNELLYTAVSRAREKLHIICEIDTFFKGVKSQKVKGLTLEDKIKTFQGKVEFEEMKRQMLVLEAQKRIKDQGKREKEKVSYPAEQETGAAVKREVQQEIAGPNLSTHIARTKPARDMERDMSQTMKAWVNYVEEWLDKEPPDWPQPVLRKQVEVEIKVPSVPDKLEQVSPAVAAMRARLASLRAQGLVK